MCLYNKAAYSSVAIYFSVREQNLANIVAQQIDITEPLSRLRELLEERIGISLIDYEFYLQNEQQVRVDCMMIKYVA